MVPNLVTGVWVGGEDRSIHFKDIAYGQGATMALPIWALFMKSVYDNEDLLISKEDFESPDVLTIPIDCDKYEIIDVNQDIFEDENLEDLGF